jgi:hypothetical protein
MKLKKKLIKKSRKKIRLPKEALNKKISKLNKKNSVRKCKQTQVNFIFLIFNYDV